MLTTSALEDLSLTEHGGNGWRPRPTGVMEALIAAGVGYSLLPSIVFAWEHIFRTDPPEWAKGAMPNFVAALLLSPIFWLLTKAARTWRVRHTHATPKAKGNRVSVYVANFGDDEIGRSARDSVIASLRSEFGKDQIEVLPAGLQLRLSEVVGSDDAAVEAANAGRQLLRKRRGDLLIWGQVYTIAAKAVLELRFVTAQQDGSEGERFGFTDKLMLDADFVPKMGTVLAALAAAQALPAATDAGRYLTNVLSPIAVRLERLIQSLPPGVLPADRIEIYNSYGLIQSVIGEQTGENWRVLKAVASYREALNHCTPDHRPQSSNTIKANLAAALAKLGAGQSEPKYLLEAVKINRDLLHDVVRGTEPANWGTIQHNLGVCLTLLGERETGDEDLENAVQAFREALEERPRDRCPLEWAATKNSLAAALMRLAERVLSRPRRQDIINAAAGAAKEAVETGLSDPNDVFGFALSKVLVTAGEQSFQRKAAFSRLEEAIKAFREALEVRTRDKVPLRWAQGQSNLGAALLELAHHDNRNGLLEDAVEACRQALKERPRDRHPLQWAETQEILGIALMSIGENTRDAKQVAKAIDVFQEVLEVRTRNNLPLNWAMTQLNLGIALTILGELKKERAPLEKAVISLEAAKEAFDPNASPYYHSRALSGLNRAKELTNIICL